MKSGIDTIFILAAYFLAACASKNTQKPDESGIRSSAEIEITQVKTVPSVKKAFNYYIQATGKISSRVQSKLQFRQNGLLEKIYVSNGQTVNKGQILAQLDKTDFEIALQKAAQQAALHKVTYQDLLIQHKADLKDESELDPKLREYFRTVSGLAEAELLLKEAQIKLDYCTLQAPLSGIVADLDFKPYNQITGDKVFCLIYADHELELITQILESEIGMLQKGLKAVVQPLSNSGDYPAEVSEINPYVGDKGLIQVKLRLLKTQGLLPGMNAAFSIAVPQKAALVIPKSAIVVRSGKKVVFTEEGGLAKWNYVETGLENEQEIEITKGLEAGQKVITDHNLQLDHDSPVKPMRKP